ncbi:MAG TPA: ABC transporter ATP-binding protein [Candidatus Baltobacteraceae bacterium]
MSVVLEGVSKHFGAKSALHEISQTFESGSLTSLVGPSGCGKTTLLRVIAGLELPDSGRILFDNVDVTEAPLRDRHVGFVYQQYALFPHLTVADNIGFGLAVRKQKRADVNARVAELLELVRLGGYEKRLPRELSGGERQRVALARALAAEPKLLLLDEPFAALDVHVRKDLRRWLRDLHERVHVTTVLVTHDADEAMEVSDQLVVMRAGRVQQAGTPQNVYEEPANPFVMQFIGGANVVVGSSSEVYMRPRDLRIDAQPFVDAFSGVVDRVVDLGDRSQLEIRLGDGQRIVADLDLARARELSLDRGDAVWIKATRTREFGVSAA